MVFRFFCFTLTCFLASTSLFVFIVFNFPPTKKYLYNLLGADYIKSKIGNPGYKTLIIYGAPLVGLYATDIITKQINVAERNDTARKTLDTNLKTIS